MNQPRKPKGTPTGGQFAGKAHVEAGDTLVNDQVIEETVDEFGFRRISRYTDGKLNDGPSGEPAEIWYRPGGSVEYEVRYKCGWPNDGPNGEPAVIEYYLDGAVRRSEHWSDGVQKS